MVCQSKNQTEGQYIEASLIHQTGKENTKENFIKEDGD